MVGMREGKRKWFVGLWQKRMKSVKKNALLFRGTHFGHGCRNRVVIGLLKTLRRFTFKRHYRKSVLLRIERGQ
jgi:hypothetical protein